MEGSATERHKPKRLRKGTVEASNSLIYKEEVCLDQESGRTHRRSSPENEHANVIGLDNNLDDGDRELRDENDDQAFIA